MKALKKNLRRILEDYFKSDSLSSDDTERELNSRESVEEIQEVKKMFNQQSQKPEMDSFFNKLNTIVNLQELVKNRNSPYPEIIRALEDLELKHKFEDKKASIETLKQAMAGRIEAIEASDKLPPLPTNTAPLFSGAQDHNPSVRTSVSSNKDSLELKELPGINTIIGRSFFTGERLLLSFDEAKKLCISNQKDRGKEVMFFSKEGETERHQLKNYLTDKKTSLPEEQTPVESALTKLTVNPLIAKHLGMTEQAVLSLIVNQFTMNLGDDLGPFQSRNQEYIFHVKNENEVEVTLKNGFTGIHDVEDGERAIGSGQIDAENLISFEYKFTVTLEDGKIKESIQLSEEEYLQRIDLQIALLRSMNQNKDIKERLHFWQGKKDSLTTEKAQKTADDFGNTEQIREKIQFWDAEVDKKILNKKGGLTITVDPIYQPIKDIIEGKPSAPKNFDALKKAIDMNQSIKKTSDEIKMEFKNAQFFDSDLGSKLLNLLIKYQEQNKGEDESDNRSLVQNSIRRKQRQLVHEKAEELAQQISECDPYDMKKVIGLRLDRMHRILSHADGDPTFWNAFYESCFYEKEEEESTSLLKQPWTVCKSKLEGTLLREKMDQIALLFNDDEIGGKRLFIESQIFEINQDITGSSDYQCAQALLIMDDIIEEQKRVKKSVAIAEYRCNTSSKNNNESERFVEDYIEKFRDSTQQAFVETLNNKLYEKVGSVAYEVFHVYVKDKKELEDCQMEQRELHHRQERMVRCILYFIKHYSTNHPILAKKAYQYIKQLDQKQQEHKHKKETKNPWMFSFFKTEEAEPVYFSELLRVEMRECVRLFRRDLDEWPSEGWRRYYSGENYDRLKDKTDEDLGEEINILRHMGDLVHNPGKKIVNVPVALAKIEKYYKENLAGMPGLILWDDAVQSIEQREDVKRHRNAFLEIWGKEFDSEKPTAEIKRLLEYGLKELDFEKKEDCIIFQKLIELETLVDGFDEKNTVKAHNLYNTIRFDLIKRYYKQVKGGKKCCFPVEYALESVVFSHRRDGRVFVAPQGSGELKKKLRKKLELKEAAHLEQREMDDIKETQSDNVPNDFVQSLSSLVDSTVLKEVKKDYTDMKKEGRNLGIPEERMLASLFTENIPLNEKKPLVEALMELDLSEKYSLEKSEKLSRINPQIAGLTRVLEVLDSTKISEIEKPDPFVNEGFLTQELGSVEQRVEIFDNYFEKIENGEEEIKDETLFDKQCNYLESQIERAQEVVLLRNLNSINVELYKTQLMVKLTGEDTWDLDKVCSIYQKKKNGGEELINIMKGLFVKQCRRHTKHDAQWYVAFKELFKEDRWCLALLVEAKKQTFDELKDGINEKTSQGFWVNEKRSYKMRLQNRGRMLPLQMDLTDQNLVNKRKDWLESAEGLEFQKTRILKQTVGTATIVEHIEEFSKLLNKKAEFENEYERLFKDKSHYERFLLKYASLEAIERSSGRLEVAGKAFKTTEAAGKIKGVNSALQKWVKGYENAHYQNLVDDLINVISLKQQGKGKFKTSVGEKVCARLIKYKRGDLDGAKWAEIKKQEYLEVLMENITVRCSNPNDQVKEIEELIEKMEESKVKLSKPIKKKQSNKRTKKVDLAEVLAQTSVLDTLGKMGEVIGDLRTKQTEIKSKDKQQEEKDEQLIRERMDWINTIVHKTDKSKKKKKESTVGKISSASESSFAECKRSSEERMSKNKYYRIAKDFFYKLGENKSYDNEIDKIKKAVKTDKWTTDSPISVAFNQVVSDVVSEKIQCSPTQELFINHFRKKAANMERFEQNLKQLDQLKRKQPSTEQHKDSGEAIKELKEHMDTYSELFEGLKKQDYSNIGTCSYAFDLVIPLKRVSITKVLPFMQERKMVFSQGTVQKILLWMIKKNRLINNLPEDQSRKMRMAKYNTLFSYTEAGMKLSVTASIKQKEGVHSALAKMAVSPQKMRSMYVSGKSAS